MAEALVSTFLPQVLGKLSSLILNELGLLCSVKEEMRKLRTTLLIIQGVLQDAEEKQVMDKAVRSWLGQLKDAAYDADDLLDEITTEALRRKVVIQGSVVEKVCHFISLSNPLVFDLMMGHKLKDIRDKLDAIAKVRSDYGLTAGVANKHLEVSHSDPTDSFVIASEIYGRDEDKEKIVHFLIATGNQENLSIIPIVGMGGLGKTTLAQMAYNDQRVEKKFDLKRWIHVSDQIDIMSLTRKILESLTEENFTLSNMDIMQSRLQNNLRGKKFLLVLDDIWSEDHDMSERLKNLLGCGTEGSKIIVTTRSEIVASIWGTIDLTYRLEGLQDNDCWIVFKQRAFRAGREESANFVVIGKEIVKKCDGLPLAAKTLGSLMYLKRDENEWLSIKNSEIWKISEEPNRILPALKLSYNYLPSHLKECFAFLSIFEKSFSFEKDDLIQKWMACGFLQSFEVTKQMEDIGTEYLNDLVSRSLLQVEEKDKDGNATKLVMHDLISDLARSIAGDECLNVKMEDNSLEDIPTATRHLLLYLSESSPIQELMCKASNLRTLEFVIVGKHIKEIPGNIFVALRCLRLLELSYTSIKSLSSSIGNLKHLRYLNLSKTDIQMLPTSICNLLNLQTLNLSGCCLLKELPKDMWKMISLRHLNISGCDLLNHIPSRFGQLRCLQTLPMFVVCKESGCSSLGELKGLSLRGELNIKKLKNLRNAVEAREANLKEKHYLRKLRLSWDDDGEATSIEGIEQVMEGLQPPPRLKRLLIDDYGGVKFSSWMMDSLLPNLVEISLINCKKCKQLPPLGQLRFLKVLILKQMEEVKCVDSTVGEILFPSLEELTLEGMPNLEKWWGEEGAQVVLPLLAKLTVSSCPKLTTLPICPTLDKLQLSWSNNNAIRSVVNFSLLSSLKIVGLLDLICLPIGFLPNLRTLHVHHCPKLIHLPTHLENTPSMKEVLILDCSELLSIPKLNHLEKLILFDDENLEINFLTRDCLRGLTSLKELYIYRHPNLKSLPDGIQHLTLLRLLAIWNCPELESLPMGLQYITTFQILEVRACNKLMYLPDWLGNLTTLKELWIGECPHLERRCEKDTGEDWHKIAHIPEIFINERKVS